MKRTQLLIKVLEEIVSISPFQLSHNWYFFYFLLSIWFLKTDASHKQNTDQSKKT
jgi:hypothetical protein